MDVSRSSGEMSESDWVWDDVPPWHSCWCHCGLILLLIARCLKLFISSTSSAFWTASSFSRRWRLLSCSINKVSLVDRKRSSLSTSCIFLRRSMAALELVVWMTQASLKFFLVCSIILNADWISGTSFEPSARQATSSFCDETGRGIKKSGSKILFLF